MGKYTYKHLGHKLYDAPGVIDESKIVEIDLDPRITTLKAMERARRARESKPVKKAQGGFLDKKELPNLKEKGFPDLSGDGKITKKDILMGRGVIKKGAKNGKK